jgi:hypothetical protein
MPGYSTPITGARRKPASRAGSGLSGAAAHTAPMMSSHISEP